MDCVYTQGKTIFTCSINDRVKIILSVLSRRACLIAMYKSEHNKWKNIICELNPAIDICGIFTAYGFQPDTGYFIVTKNREN